MDTFLPFQGIVTVSIAAVPVTTPPSPPAEIIQSRSGHLDLADAAAALVRVEILNLATGTLFLETAISEDGPWFGVEDWGPSTSLPLDQTLQLATYYSAQNKLGRFLRWRFENSSTTTEARVTFRMRYQLP